MKFEQTFDNATSDYDQSRPFYPKQLYQDLFDYKQITSDSHVLEIGLGTGKATAPILKTGCHYTGIEPGANLAAAAKGHLKDFKNFTFLNLTLQDYICRNDFYDLIYAATAFHWIPEEYGYKRVFELLKSGGVFARFAYHAGPDKERKSLTGQIQELYKMYMSSDRKYKEYTAEDAKRLSDTAIKYGFVNTKYMLYHITKDFTADEYMALLRTYPDHMAIEETSRRKLFDGIRSAISQNGGMITVYYTMDMELSQKP